MLPLSITVACYCASLREAAGIVTTLAGAPGFTANHFHADSTDNTFPIEDWSVSMISVLLMLLVKENAINEPIEFN